jgi:hypothetical protein
MDWFKGKSTGNPWVFSIKLIGVSGFNFPVIQFCDINPSMILPVGTCTMPYHAILSPTLTIARWIPRASRAVEGRH